MVFESLISPKTAEKHHWEMVFMGFLYTSIAMALSLWIFRDYAGLISVFFTVIASIPMVYDAFKIEEEKIDYAPEEKSLLKEHSRVIMFFIFLFIGMTLAFTTWYVFLPNEISQSVFSAQSNTIADINTKVISGTSLFSTIFLNNLKVLTFCLLFSFFYGAGAIFILTWNASVIAVAMGGLIKSSVLVSKSGPVLSHITGYSTALVRYFIHGLPEISAYFVAALAGGIISASIIKRDIMTKKFQKIAFDTSSLIIISIFLLLFAGLIETYITPFLY